MKRSRWTRLTGIVCCWVVFCSFSGHWIVLQSMAWAKMIYEYSRTETIERSLVKTFDGKNPCKMCRKIAKGRAAESEKKNNPASSQEKKTELFCQVVTGKSLVHSFSASRYIEGVSKDWVRRAIVPPLRPPQGFVVQQYS